MSIAAESLTAQPIGGQKHAIVTDRRPVSRILVPKPDLKLTPEPR
jgi:hypothetical protein